MNHSLVVSVSLLLFFSLAYSGELSHPLAVRMLTQCDDRSCTTCSSASECTACSSYSSLKNQACECAVENCVACKDNACDECEEGRVLYNSAACLKSSSPLRAVNLVGIIAASGSLVVAFAQYVFAQSHYPHSPPSGLAPLSVLLFLQNVALLPLLNLETSAMLDAALHDYSFALLNWPKSMNFLKTDKVQDRHGAPYSTRFSDYTFYSSYFLTQALLAIIFALFLAVASIVFCMRRRAARRKPQQEEIQAED